ncbi:MAG: AAA family ATPase, partial [Deltaproteobacteria bacterium]|nr:AAA family ATPase [Deltaproteobacteria bacterium]
MYEEFYGFRDNPFRLTPDPDYLFLSANHQEALGHLLFGVSEGSGVVVITGEVGTGKTTLLRTLVRNLDARTTVAYIFNPALSALELLQTINADLGLPATSTSKKELIDELNRFLLDQQAAGRRVVVIVDEAQDLEPGVLEQLRLLSNLETEREKLLQIMLVGQPELRNMLARPELAQLDQRVTLRWHLGPLNAEETAAYVRHRVRLAAEGREPVRFTPGALRQVYSFSRGVPRVINVLCHRALLIGYTREEHQLSRAVVRQAAKELQRHEPTSSGLFPRRSFAFNALLAGVLLLLVGELFVLAPMRGWLPMLAPHRSEETTATLPRAAEADKGENPVLAAAPPHAKPLAPAPSSGDVQPPDAQAPALVPPPLAAEVTARPTLPTAVATVQPVVRDEEAAEAFLHDLQRMELVDSAVRATDGLLRAWGVEGLQAGDWRNGALDLSAIAQARHLEYLPLSGTFNLLSLLDLPVILELIVPTRREARFVLLLGIAGNRCRVLLDREREVPIRVLNEHWFGKAHLFWEDFDNVGFLLTVGSVGQNVKRLHALLSKTQGLDGEGTLTGRLDTFS